MEEGRKREKQREGIKLYNRRKMRIRKKEENVEREFSRRNERGK